MLHGILNQSRYEQTCSTAILRNNQQYHVIILIVNLLSTVALMDSGGPQVLFLRVTAYL